MHNNMRSVVLLITLALTLASCDKKPGEGALEIKDAAELKPTIDSVQQNFVNVRCISCHELPTAKNRHVSLARLSETIEGNGQNPTGGHIRQLIKPGCPKQSLFSSILREGKMPPPPMAKIEEKEIQIIEDWIRSLNPKATCEDSGEPPDDSDDF